MILSTTIIEDIRLDFAVWLAKRARKFRCDDQDIVAALQESHHVTATHPAADVAPTSSAGTEGDTDRQKTAVDADIEEQELIEISTATELPEQLAGPTADPLMSEPATPKDAGSVASEGLNVPETPEVLLTPEPSISRRKRLKNGGDVIAPEAAETPVVHPHRGETLASKIRALQEKYPDWTARQIAERLDKHQRDINAAAKAAGITIHRLTAEEVIARRREGGKIGGSVSPTRAKAPLPVAPPSTVLGTAGADETYRTIKKPKGQRFRLRTGNGTGKYLHMSCIGLVPGTDYAWTGTEAQMVAVRSKFPETLDMREELVT